MKKHNVYYFSKLVSKAINEAFDFNEVKADDNLVQTSNLLLSTIREKYPLIFNIISKNRANYQEINNRHFYFVDITIPEMNNPDNCLTISDESNFISMYQLNLLYSYPKTIW